MNFEYKLYEGRKILTFHVNVDCNNDPFLLQLLNNLSAENNIIKFPKNNTVAKIPRTTKTKFSHLNNQINK